MRADTTFGRKGDGYAVPVQALAPLQPFNSANSAAPLSTLMSVPAPHVARGIFIPWLSFVILGLLAAVFWAELHFPVSPASGMTPSLRTVIALGGDSRDLVFGKGEWWRVFTAPLMHGGLDHILSNSVALFFAGRFLEKIAGWRWTAALFVLGALGGAAGSLAMNPPQVVGVGASGAIMAMLAALFVLSFDNQVVEKTGRLQGWTLFLLVPALLPAAAGSHVDVSAHLGGAITGVILGYFLQATWDEEREEARFQSAAVWIGITGFALAALAFLLVATHFAESRIQVAAIYEPKLMAETDIAGLAENDAGAGELVRRFPDDPRARLFYALHLLRVDDVSGAQSELRAALDQRKVLDEVSPRFTAMLQVLLAATQLRQGRLDDARKTAAPACGPAADDEALSGLMQTLRDQGVCPD